MRRTGLDVPDAHALVKRPRHDQVGLRVVVDAEDVVGVAGQRLHILALKPSRQRGGSLVYEQSAARALRRHGARTHRLHVENLDRLVVRGGADVLGVRRPAHARPATARRVPMARRRSVRMPCATAHAAGEATHQEMSEMPCEWPVRVCWNSPSSASQILMVLSAAARRRARRQHWWRVSTATYAPSPVLRSPVQHAQADASHFPSGLNLTLDSAFRWPWRVYRKT